MAMFENFSFLLLFLSLFFAAVHLEAFSICSTFALIFAKQLWTKLLY
jgi:hypothetical protein